jgi:hypothetical protein
MLIVVCYQKGTWNPDNSTNSPAAGLIKFEIVCVVGQTKTMFLLRQHTKPAWDIAPSLVVYFSLHLIASPLFIFLKVDKVFAV